MIFLLDTLLCSLRWRKLFKSLDNNSIDINIQFLNILISSLTFIQVYIRTIHETESNTGQSPIYYLVW